MLDLDRSRAAAWMAARLLLQNTLWDIEDGHHAISGVGEDRGRRSRIVQRVCQLPRFLAFIRARSTGRSGRP